MSRYTLSVGLDEVVMVRDTSVGFSFVLWSFLGTLSYVALFVVIFGMLIVDKSIMPIGGWSYAVAGLSAWLVGGYLEAQTVRY